MAVQSPCMCGHSVRHMHARENKLLGETSSYDENSKQKMLKIQDANFQHLSEDTNFELRITTNCKKLLNKQMRNARTLNTANFRV